MCRSVFERYIADSLYFERKYWSMDIKRFFTYILSILLLFSSTVFASAETNPESVYNVDALFRSGEAADATVSTINTNFIDGPAQVDVNGANMTVKLKVKKVSDTSYLKSVTIDAEYTGNDTNLEAAVTAKIGETDIPSEFTFTIPFRSPVKVYITKQGSSSTLTLYLHLDLSNVETGGDDQPETPPGDGEKEDEITTNAGIYSVPIICYVSDTVAQKYESYTAAGNNRRIMLNGRALAKANTDGSYQITLQYYSRSIYEYIQVVNPAKVAEARANSTYLGELLAGVFDYPDSTSAPATVDKTGASDHYYLTGSAIQIKPGVGGSWDDAMDIGYITFSIPNLADEILMKAYSELLSSRSNIIIKLLPESAVRLPDNLTYAPGEYEIGWAWTNVDSNSDINYGRDSAATLAELNSMLNPTVKVSVDENGEIIATFTLAEALAGNAVTKVEIGKSRDLTGTTRQTYFWGDYINTTYENIPINENQFNVPYDNMAFGRSLRITTEKSPDGKRAQLRLEPNPPAIATKSSNGATLTYTQKSIPESSAFKAETVTEQNKLKFTKEQNFRSQIAISADNDHWKFYAISLLSGNSQVKPTVPVKLEIPIPDGWDIDLTYAVRFSADDMTGDISSKVDKVNRALTINTTSLDELNAEYFICQRAVPYTSLDDLGDGLYRVHASILHRNFDQPSMSNPAIVENTGYLAVNGTEKTFYAALRSVNVSTFWGYIYRAFTIEGSAGGDKNEIEYLSFHTNNDGSLMDDDNHIASDYDLVYPKTIAISLPEPDASGYYYLSFIVPVMDGFGGTPGDGNAEAAARLVISSVESIATNPLVDYDKSVILVKIKEAQNLATTLNPATDSMRIEELTAAILTAQVAYNNANLTSDSIKAARDALTAVIGAPSSSTPGEQPNEPGDKDDVALAQGDYPIDIKLWNFSGNHASMGNAALAHDESFVRVGSDGTAEAHLFFKALTFAGLTGHLEKLSLVTNITRDENNIVTYYNKTPAVIISDYNGKPDATDSYGPINATAYPHEVSIPVEIGATYTTVEVFVPVMEKAVGGAGTQLARLQIDWSALGVDETPEPPIAAEPPVTKTPEATETVTITPEVKDGTVSGGGKIAESTVTAEQASTITTKASAVAADAKTTVAGAAKIAAGENVVAEIIIAVGDTAETKAVAVAAAKAADVTEATFNVPKTVAAAIVAESAKIENASVELVLTIESALASGLATVTLDAATLAQTVSAAGEAETVAITVTADATATLTEAQKTPGVIPANKVPVSVTISAGNERITDLAHAIAITIPYVKTSGNDKKVVVWYVPASGDKIKYDAVCESGRLTFITDKI
jgi:hypothetical protein